MHMFLTIFIRNLIQKQDLAGSSDTEKKRKAGSYGTQNQKISYLVLTFFIYDVKE
jgi:hypothetical protein